MWYLKTFTTENYKATQVHKSIFSHHTLKGTINESVSFWIRHTYFLNWLMSSRFKSYAHFYPKKLHKKIHNVPVISHIFLTFLHHSKLLFKSPFITALKVKLRETECERPLNSRCRFSLMQDIIFCILALLGYVSQPDKNTKTLMQMDAWENSSLPLSHFAQFSLLCWRNKGYSTSLALALFPYLNPERPNKKVTFTRFLWI